MRPRGVCPRCGTRIYGPGGCPKCKPPVQLRDVRKADRRALSELLREEREKRRAAFDADSGDGGDGL
jgi:hypothetical protein